MRFKDKKILFFVNELDFFLSHRLPLARAAREQGFQVHVAGPRAEAVPAIEACGFVFHHIPMSRSGARLNQELITFLEIYRLIGRLQPDIVHNVAMKAVLYGSLAAKLAGAGAVVNALTGLGYVFIAEDAKTRLLKRVIMQALRFAFRLKSHRLILQNNDDPRLFIDAKVVREDEVVIIRGSGVDMDLFQPTPEPTGAIRVVLVSRMLWDKGVGEFVAAARELKRRGSAVRFILVGAGDPGNPACVPVPQLEAWAREGDVEWLGHSKEVAGVFALAHIVCLPSYREGLPKVLIEAAACGRAIITSDVPGCREIVRDGENGILVPLRDGGAIADAVERLALDGALRRRMAACGRELAVEEFSVQRVLRETLALYGTLLEP